MVIWLRPDDFHNTLFSFCLMHFRGNSSMNHIIVNKVIKYIKAYMIDWSYVNAPYFSTHKHEVSTHELVSYAIYFNSSHK